MPIHVSNKANHAQFSLYYVVLQLLSVMSCILMVYFEARDCVNKEVGEGCPGDETQVQDCQERNCPGAITTNQPSTRIKGKPYV